MQDQRVVIQYPKQRERMKNHMMAAEEAAAKRALQAAERRLEQAKSSDLKNDLR